MLHVKGHPVFILCHYSRLISNLPVFLDPAFLCCFHKSRKFEISEPIRPASRPLHSISTLISSHLRLRFTSSVVPWGIPRTHSITFSRSRCHQSIETFC